MNQSVSILTQENLQVMRPTTVQVARGLESGQYHYMHTWYAEVHEMLSGVQQPPVEAPAGDDEDDEADNSLTVQEERLQFFREDCKATLASYESFVKGDSEQAVRSKRMLQVVSTDPVSVVRTLIAVEYAYLAAMAEVRASGPRLNTQGW